MSEHQFKEWQSAIEAAAKAVESMDITEPALFASNRWNAAALVRSLAVKLIEEQGGANAISKAAGWIRVEDRLPDNEQKVLAYWKGSSTIESCESLTYQAADQGDGHEAWINAWGERADPPTHWQPMIEAP